MHKGSPEEPLGEDLCFTKDSPSSDGVWIHDDHWQALVNQRIQAQLEEKSARERSCKTGPKVREVLIGISEGFPDAQV
jgi:hypothetical protein